jgi:ammonium transporter
MDLTLNDQMWLLVCSGLVLMMQAGFLCLEAGLTRSKNAVNVALKNVIDLAISPILYWFVGAGLMFGPTVGGWIGNGKLIGDSPSASLVAFLFFQMMFCATAATIVSGATAERLRFTAYIVVTVAMTGLVYPVIGHWVWGGVWGGGPAGWLRALGFYDFAGSGVVHLTGGAASLGALLVLGPRIGRFDPERVETGFPKASYPLAMTGALILVVGWVGFNGGSTLRLDASIGLIVLNTMLAASAGSVAGALASRLRTPLTSPDAVINGLLGGLVAICAGANAFTPGESVAVGALAGGVAVLCDRLLVLLRIDDAIGAVPVHAAGGVAGLLAVAVLGDTTVTLQSGTLLERLGVQALGAAAIGLTALFSTYLLLKVLMPFSWVRVTESEELRGMNWAEHGVESEYQVLCQGIDRALDGSGHSLAARIDASDEAGALASRYAAMLTNVARESELAAQAEAERQRTAEMRDYGLFLHGVLDGMEDAVCILGPSGQIIEANSAWARFAEGVGRTDEARIGSSLPEFCSGGCVYMGGGCDDIVKAVAEVAGGHAERFDGEYVALVHGDRRTLRVRLTPLPGGERGSVVMTQHDCTEATVAERWLLKEKQKAETLAEALATSQRSLDLAIQGAGLGTWHWDVEAGYFEVSRDWLHQLGHESSAFGSDIEAFRALLHPDDLVLWTSEDARSIAGDEPYDRQFRVRHALGGYAWVQALGRSLSSSDDGPQTFAGIVIDIDARKRAELRNAGMAKIIEESVNEVYVVDDQSLRLIEVNRGGRENLGYTIDELRTLSKADLNGELTPQEMEKRLAPLLANEVDRLEFETIHRRKDGSTYPIMLSVQRTVLTGQSVIVVFGIDLTKRRELEAQLSQAQKLESIGQLAAGVAHEMNTPLQYVSNNIKFLSDCSAQLFEVIDAYEQSLDLNRPETPLEDRYAEVAEVLRRTRFDRVRAEVPKAIGDSLEGVSRVLEIVRSMKEFSHPGHGQKAPTDLNRALASTATLTRNRWKQHAELELDLAADLPFVECYPGEINQVFVNLLVNAVDAIAQKTERQGLTQPGRIVVRTRCDGDHALIEVEDNGCGMPQEVLCRVFDPFYTTKPVGQGTGQGLSLSRSIIVQKHGGTISAESRTGAGSTFRVRLPLVAERGVTEISAPAPAAVGASP